MDKSFFGRLKQVFSQQTIVTHISNNQVKVIDLNKYQQSGVVKKGQVKGPGNQYGADFFLSGAISSIVSKQGGKSSVQYQIEMKLVNISTGELVWSGIEKIRKNFKRSSSNR